MASSSTTSSSTTTSSPPPPPPAPTTTAPPPTTKSTTTTTKSTTAITSTAAAAQTSQCPHIAAALGTGDGQNVENDISTKYTSVVAWAAYRALSASTAASTSSPGGGGGGGANGRPPTKRRKIAAPACGTCTTALTRPLACLQCAFIGCWEDGHGVLHLKSTGHQFCVDAKTGAVYCADCGDFIYHPRLEQLQLTATVRAEEKVAKAGQGSSKVVRESYKPWVPNPTELQALQGAEPIPCHGRRPLLNLGQTCYMNVVLQSFIHNPLLRNYFLSDKHNAKQCKIESCMCCEMDRLFAEIYSDPTTPYAPTSFLYTSWRLSTPSPPSTSTSGSTNNNAHSSSTPSASHTPTPSASASHTHTFTSPPELAGYAQQDAHEFFIASMNHIHATSRGCTNVSCNCIIHSTFSGSLQSDVMCERCRSVTSVVDPVLDISLEIRGAGAGGGPGAREGGGETLGACLRRFTQPEKLGKEYNCAKCAKASPEATKRFSIRKLPPVLAFQFKRFEHKTNDKSSARKIATPVRFPATLNMAPYTTQAMKLNASSNGNGAQNGHGHGKEGNGAHSLYPGREAMCEYDLFAVINHEGSMDNGHYTNFARCRDEWFKFDDDKVTPSSLGACLASNAYMCFYVKRYLDYKPNTIPSYVLTREQEMQREKELEKEKIEKEREREKREREAREREEREREEKEREKEAMRMKELKELDDELLSTL